VLVLAALYGFADCCEILLKYGAPVNYKTREGQTPLMKAVGSGDAATVSLLIGSGADTSFQSESGLTVYDIATASQASEELINELNVSRE
jgi:ankyrin repeat protein